MLTTVKGIYDQGKIILIEELPVKNTKAEVMVTFLDDEKKELGTGKQKIILGLLEGKIDTPDDFNDPLVDLKDYM